MLRRVITAMVAIGLAPWTWADRSFVFEHGLNGYTGFEDTSIYSERIDNAGGGFSGIFSGTTNQFDDRRALLRVDLSAIPPGSAVTGVSLTLTVRRSGGDFGAFDFSLHRLTADWRAGDAVDGTEGGFGTAAAAGDATWAANFHTVSSWANSGGDFSVLPSAIAAAGREGEIAVWTDAGLVTDVQAWVDDPGSNFGWILVSAIEGTRQRVKRFDSSEAPSSRPRLIVRVATELPEDINFDGTVDAVDVQLTINEALGIAIAPLTADVNDDGMTDAVDVQRVIIAALS